MLKALINKQFTEIFKSYFVNQKTGKARKKVAVIGMFVLFIAILALLGSTFFGISAMFSDLLKIPGYEWLYFAVMSVVAMLFGLLGSVFNTYSSLYLAKDNELLLSMPIKVRDLLLARLSGVVGLSLLYSASVSIPAIIGYFVFGKVKALALVFQILLIPVLSVLISVFACLLGFVVAIISTKLKNKSIITVIISLVFIGIYYFFWFRMSNIITSIITNSEAVGKGIKTWANLIYQIGMASSGDALAFAIIVGITTVLAAGCFAVLSKTFMKLITINKGEKKATYKKTAEKQSSVDSAILKKELKRFTSSATYMLNCGLGVVIMPIAAIIAVIKRSYLLESLEKIKENSPEYYGLLPIAVVVGIFIMASVGSISCPSVSLEGKSLWIYKSLPIDTYKILRAKIKLHIYITAVPVIISSVLMGYAFALDYSLIALITLCSYIFVSFSGTLGLILGLLKPNLNWVTETTPIKQSLPVFLNLAIGFAVPAGILILGYFTRKMITPDNFIIVVLVFFALATRYLGNWVRTKGTIIFENL